MYKFKRFLSVFLCLILIFPLFPNVGLNGSVYAGTPEEPIIKYIDNGSKIQVMVYFSDSYQNPHGAYLSGEFNKWKYDREENRHLWKNEKDYNLNWQPDIDGRYRLFGEFDADELNNKEFKIRFRYSSTPEISNPWFPNNNLRFIPPAIINPINPGIKFNVSRDYASNNDEIEFFLSEVDDNKFNKIIKEDVVYSVKDNIHGVRIEDNKVILSNVNQSNIELEATYRGVKYTKLINIVNEENNVTNIHYHRYDNNYFGWDIYFFNKQNNNGKFDFSVEMPSEKIAKKVFDGNDYKFIVRKLNGSNWEKEERAFSVSNDTNKNYKDIYVVEGHNSAFYSYEEYFKFIQPKILVAIMDNKTTINGYLSSNDTNDIQLSVLKNGVDIIPLKKVEINERKFSIELNEEISSVSDFYEVISDKKFLKNSVIMRNILNDFSYEENDLGLKKIDGNYQLKLWAPTAKSVELQVFNDGSKFDTNYIVAYAMEKSGNIWKKIVSLEENKNKFYLYKITFPNGDVKFAVDPYAVSVGINGDKAAFITTDDESTIPDGWNLSKPKLVNKEDSIIYEMHVRDFTIDKESGIDDFFRGKFLGVSKTGTRLNGGEIKTGVDHLVELGITHVHLLPIYDQATVKEEVASLDDLSNRNWGYDPKNYNSPEGSYVTDPTKPHLRIKELRQMVQQLHDNNIRVVADVVYNHMYSTEYMDNIVPGYFFRSDEYGKYTNGAGVGNELATERKMVRKFIVDSVKHWLKTYNIDGLRFDLMALIDEYTMERVSKEAFDIDESILIYGEPWTGGPPSALSYEKQTHYGDQKGKGYAMFNGIYRDFLRGDNQPGKGYVNNNTDVKSEIEKGLKGSHEIFTNDPEETINYVEVHDNYNLFDQIAKTSGNGNEEFDKIKNFTKNEILPYHIVRRLNLAQGLIYSSQGIALTHSGTEFLRTKYGEHNSYNMPDAINRLEWENKEKFKNVFDYQKGLIELRKNHPAFRLTTKELIQKHLKTYIGDGNSILIHLNNLKSEEIKDDFSDIVILFNPTDNEVDLTDEVNALTGYSNKKWNVLVNAEKSGDKVIETIEGQIKVPYISMMVLTPKDVIQGNITQEYLFSDQSKLYMTPTEPKSSDSVTLRFRAKADDDITEAYVHYYEENVSTSDSKTEKMTEVNSDFYIKNGFDKNDVKFYEITLPPSSNIRYYNFEVKSNDKVYWISGGTPNGGNNNGVSLLPEKYGDGIAYGFRIVPDYSTNPLKESILYQIMVDRFRNGDKLNDRTVLDPSVSNNPLEFNKPSEILTSNDISKSGLETDKIWNNDFYNGDLTGVREAIPYLKKQLGITGIYFMPIFQSESNHKYDTTDYDFVDKNFGGNKEFIELRKNLSENNMKVILDGVFNHTGSNHKWFKKAMDTNYSENAKYKNYYFIGNSVSNVSEGYYGWKKLGSLPKLNYSSEDVKNEIYKGSNSVILKYIKAPFNIDGWRLDAAEDVSETPSEYKLREYNGEPIVSQEHLNSNIKIWNEIRESIDTVDESKVLIGEYWKTNPVWFEKKVWDGKMNYSGFHTPFIENRSTNNWLGKQSIDGNGDMSVSDIGRFTRQDMAKYPYQTRLNSINSISTHDRPRFLDWEYTNKRDGLNNKLQNYMEIAATLQMTQVGIPMIYYGDEIGMYSKKTREDYSTISQGNDPYNRDSFDWNFDNWDKEMFRDYQKLIATRKSQKNAFVYGAFEELKSNSDKKYIVYSRYGENNEKAIVILNNNLLESSEIRLENLDKLGIKDGLVLKDVLTEKEFKVIDKSITVNSESMSAMVLVPVDKFPSIPDEINKPELIDLDDSRIKLKAPREFEYEIGEKSKLTWKYLNQEGAKSFLVKAYDKNNVILEEKEIGLDKNQTFMIKAEKYAIKVLSDRIKNDGEVDDIYSDSEYVISVSKANAPNFDSNKSDNNQNQFDIIYGLQDKDGNRVFIKRSGEYAKLEWVNINNDWYYFDSYGIAIKGWFKVNNKWYFFNEKSIMKNGWIYYKDKWYYLNASGDMRTGWLHYKDKWYYLNANGDMRTGWIYYKDKWYYLNANGDMRTGWLHYKDKWYYLNANGDMRTGWLHYKDKWYYLNANGDMATDTKIIYNVIYNFSKSGELI